VARSGGKDVPTDGINAAAKTVGDLALSLMAGMGQEIWPHLCSGLRLEPLALPRGFC
jgi:hypothetical protein